SDEFNGVTRDIHNQIPDLVMNFIRNIESRHYTSFSQAAAENAASRIFLGIHWRFDAIEGVQAGDRIADIDFDTKLRTHLGAGPHHVPSVNFRTQIDAYLNNTYGTFFGGGGQAPVAAPDDQQPIEEAPAPLQTANQRFVAQVYLDLLQREVEPG